MSINLLHEALSILDVNGKSASDITYIGTSDVKLNIQSALELMNHTDYEEGDGTVPLDLLIKGDDFIMFRMVDDSPRCVDGWALIKTNPILPTKEVSISDFNQLRTLPSSNPSDSPYPVIFDADDYEAIFSQYVDHQWPGF